MAQINRTEFIIDEGDGSVDVKRKGRAFAYDLDDLDEALARIRKARKPGGGTVGRGVEVTHWDRRGVPSIIRT